MNRHAHKIIFNKRLGRMDVVSEIVSSQGKGSQTTGYSNSITTALIKPLVFALMLTLGTAQILLPVHAAGTIVADPSAPKTEQPTILNTASGATQVNIQTPTAGGVSVNQYQQFDAQSNGTILNNSRTNANTQTAGWIQGNPWLATGTARIIVNQVNSSNPSQLSGNIEVAGNRAEVVIANPAGIQVNGASFINAARTTLSTGKPIIDNGNLTGYQVNQGQISVNGQGLNTQGSDYTDILARSVQINAGIWANQLKVTTGANTVNASNDAVTPGGSSGTSPQFAIDTGALGGMYAGKITLMGTEQGVGVNNAGQIAASAGHVTVDVNGQLSNSGTINANLDSNGAATTQIVSQSLNNSGAISSQGNTQIQTGPAANSGTLAAGRELKLNASDINNSKGTLNGQRIELNANSLNNTNGKIQQTGTQALALHSGSLSNANNGLIGYEPISSGTGTGTGTGTGSTGSTGGSTNTGTPSTATGGGSSTVVQPAPVALADGAINITGAVNNDAGQITANGGIDMTSTTGLENHATLDLRNLTVKGTTLDNSSGQLSLSGALNSTTDSLNNQAGKISAQRIQLTQQTTNNTQGSIQAIDTLTLNSSGVLNNQAGTIGANQAVNITAGSVQNNQNGNISSSQSTLNLTSTGALDNTSGTIKANQALNLSALNVTNDSGLIGSGQNLTISSPTGALSNQSGQIVAGNELKLNSSELNNQSGHISAVQTQITTGAVNNTSGSIITQNNAQITSQTLDNTSGLIYAGTTLDINTQGQTLTNQNTNTDTQGLVALQNLSVQSGYLNNSSGRIQSNQAVTLNSADINSTQGNIQVQSLNVTANSLNNNQGKVGAQDQATFTLNQNLSNQGGQIWSETGTVTVKATALDNSNGGVLSANRADLTVASLNNQQATVSANTVNIQTADLNNQSGLIESAQQSTINAARLNNTDGKITSTGQLDLTTQTASLSGQLSANGNLNLNLQADSTNSAQISSGGLAHISAQNLLNQGIIRGQALQVSSNNLTNQGNGELSSKQTTQVDVNGTLSNQGLIDGQTTLIRSGNTDNSGRIYGDQLAMSGNLNNHDTGVIATRSGTLNLAGSRITNQTGGLIHSEGDLNIGGSLDSNYQTSGSAQVVDNLGSTIESQGNMSIASAQVNNRNIGFSYSTHEIIENIPQEYYIRFTRSSDPTLAMQLFKPEELGKCRMCKDDNYDANGSESVTRYEYVPDSTRYPFAQGYARHTYQTKDVYNWFTKITDKLHYDDQDPVWQLFGVTAGDYASLVPRLEEYNADYMNRTRIAQSRDYYSVYINQRITNQSQIDNPGQAAVISSGGAMTFKGGDIFNDNSKIIAGGKLTIDNGGSLRNNESSGTKQVTVIGTWSGDNIEYDPYRIRYGWNGSGDYNQVISTETIKLSNDVVQENLGGYITGSAPTANNTTTASSSFAGGSTSTDSANGQTTQGLSGWVNIRNTTSDSISVPNSSLFTINPNAAGSYVQTDPRFTSYGTWLSSDYMLSALNLDPSNLQKRLGDGYYEQKLIRDQVAQLTGRRFLTGYRSDDDQYKALMNAGVTFAGQYNLRPGIALTPEQLARLTSDIVWLVEETVTLPNGSKVQALVPKVYVAVKPGDVTGEGALISADSMDLKLSGNLENSGTLLGRQLIKVDANNITNSGLIQSNLIDARAQLDFNNIGGTVNAHTAMNIDAGRDVNLMSTTSSAQSHSGLSNSTLTQVDRVAGLYVGNGSDSTTSDQAMTSLSVTAGRDVNLAGAVISNDSRGQTIINANGNINLNTVQTQSGLNLVASDVNNAKYLATDQIGSQINTVGDIRFKAGDSITATAANINSDAGKVILAATNDINLVNGQSQLDYESNSYHKERGLFSSSMGQTHQRSQTNTATSTNVTGQQVLIQAGHDANIVGSNVVSDNLTQINAGNDVNILAAQNTQTTEGFSISKQSGLLGTGGIGFMIGSVRTDTNSTSGTITHTGSMIASNMGDVNINAGNTLNVQGSDLQTGNNLTAVAQDINITHVTNNYSDTFAQSTKSSGLTVSLSGTVGNAANAVVSSVQQANAASDRGNDRLATAHEVKAALITAQAAQSVYQDVNDVSDANKASQGSVIGLTVSVGSSKSQYSNSTQTTQAQGSNLTAGNKVSLTATGDGSKDANGYANNGDLNIQGSNVTGQTVDLNAARDVNLTSATNTATEANSNKSSGWAVGANVGVSASGNMGISVFANANQGKGSGQGTSVTHTEAQINADTLNINSGRDTNLMGAQAHANTINADIGRNLTITSEQDTNQYDSKQTSTSVGIEIPVYGVGVGGVSGSINHNKQTITSDYQSVNEQSGLFAGSGGFNVDVTGHTQLNGGAIVSTASADKNQLSTGSLSVTDLQNTADYKATNSNVGINLGSSLSNIIAGTLISQIPQALNHGESAQSVTHSAISPANVTISGQTATADQLKSIATTADEQSIKPIFDLQTVQDQMALASAVGDVGALATNVVSTAMQREAYVARDQAMAAAEANLTPAQLAIYNSEDYKKHPEKKAAFLQNLAMSPENISAAMASHPDLAVKYKAATTNAGRQAVLNDLARRGALGAVAQTNQQFLDAQNEYGPGSDFSRAAQALSGLAAGLASGNNGQALSNLTQPFLASAIGTYFDKLELQPDGTKNHAYAAERLLAHAAAGAVVAYLSGNNAASGAIGAATGEAMALIVHDQIYGNKPNDQLTIAEKEHIRAVATLASGLAGAVSGGNFESAATAAAAGYNAAVNNELHPSQYKNVQKALGAACFVGGNFNWTDACKAKVTELQTASKSNSAYWRDSNDAQVQAFTENVRSDIEKLRGYCKGNADCNRLVDLQKVSIPLMSLGSYEEAQNYVYSFQLALQTANGNYGQMALQFIGDFGFVPAPSIVNSGVKFILVNKLTQSGVKFNKEALVAIRELPDGRVIFLEQGTSTIVNGVEKGSGLAHIMKHADQFNAKGILDSDIPQVVVDAVNRGKVVGISGASTPVFEVIYHGVAKYIAVGVGSNGYIVRANPVSKWKALP